MVRDSPPIGPGRNQRPRFGVALDSLSTPKAPTAVGRRTTPRRRPRMSSSGDRISQLLDEFRHSRDVMLGELSKVIIGQREVVELILAAIFTRGHVLLVGVPGLAKTLMVSS